MRSSRHLLRAAACALFVTVTASRDARSQDAPPPIFSRGNIVPLVGGHLGTPLKLSGYAGFAIVRLATRTSYDGLSVIAEAGQGGGRAGAGYTTFFFPAAGYRAQISALRTWGSPWNAAPGQLFVGVDTQAFLLLTGLDLGFYRRVGPSRGDNWVWSVGLSVGT